MHVPKLLTLTINFNHSRTCFIDFGQGGYEYVELRWVEVWDDTWGDRCGANETSLRMQDHNLNKARRCRVVARTRQHENNKIWAVVAARSSKAWLIRAGWQMQTEGAKHSCSFEPLCSFFKQLPRMPSGWLIHSFWALKGERALFLSLLSCFNVELLYDSKM